MSIVIRPFTMKAYASVLALWQQCEGIGLSEADSRPSIRAYLSRNPGMSFIALARGGVVGAVLAGHDGRRGYLHHLAVHPRWRRRGLGRRLVRRCLDALHRAGIRKCHIFVYRRNGQGLTFWSAESWAPRRDLMLMSRMIEPPGGGRRPVGG
jgi:N-acetylglutamate synthase